jgi:membrane protease YdiL (CAAX protease family)
MSIVARAGAPSQGFIANVVGFLGAGIYEELLFRLLLLPVVAAGLKLAGAGPEKQIVGAVIITSLLFSAAHYIGPYESWSLFSFVFRFLAGAFFAVLFVARGFGIAAGTHALFDIFVGAF